MKRILILMGIVILTSGCSINPTCSVQSTKEDGRIADTKQKGYETQVSKVESNEIKDKDDFYGFFDTSYENESTKGIAYHKSIEIDPYGKNNEKIKEKYGLILEFLKDKKLTEDEYVKIFVGTSKKDSEEYFAIKNERKNDEDYFTIYAIDRDLKANKFSVKDSVVVEGSINDPKTSLFSLDQYLLISTEAPGCSYMDNYYLKWDNSKFEFLKKHSFDPTADFLEKKINLLKSGKIDEAMTLQGIYLYPHNYKQLICKSNNLALKLFYEEARELNQEEKWEEALKYLDEEVNMYLERAVASADKDYLNYFIESESNCEYNIEKEEVIEILTLYQKLLKKNGQYDLAKEIKKELDILTK